MYAINARVSYNGPCDARFESYKGRACEGLYDSKALRNGAIVINRIRPLFLAYFMVKCHNLISL